ncbi:hypothetical protein MXD61_04305, partial [Frankia sp. AgPm24]|nr:hypothetical protein [Frankia sp. AgPm24]
ALGYQAEQSFDEGLGWLLAGVAASLGGGGGGAPAPPPRGPAGAHPAPGTGGRTCHVVHRSIRQ